MKSFKDCWDKKFKRVLAGDKSLSCYILTTVGPLLAVGKNTINPSTLLIFRQTKQNKELLGISNGEVYSLPKSESDSIRILFDRSERSELNLLANYGSHQFILPQNNESDDTEKLIILQKNLFFCEAILYDPTVSKNPLFIPYGNKALSYAELDLFVISYLRTHFPEELKHFVTGESFKWGI